ncbi:hypothetical protein ACHAW5_006667 [Stephanodiscus triporus]|uniref:Uncharacterized protein n=1 Tax=Stephanodiscus triporus TaxID=2934178 RepID=A0ABD3MLP8_9STRA
MAAAAAAAVVSATATAAYKYTYSLGRSLYVPLTSRCNSVPLPTTRGPGFALPTSVASALINVRDADMPGSVPRDYHRRELSYHDYYYYDDRENDDGIRVHLPPYDMPLVNCLYHGQQSADDVNDDLTGHLRRRRRIVATADASGGSGGDVVPDDGLLPSISTLVDEVRSRLDLQGSTTTTTTTSDGGGAAGGRYDQVVIAGEGEPTLRMDALLAVARAVKLHRRFSGGIDAYGDDDGGGRRRRSPAVRVITNGLCYGISNLGYSPHNLERDGSIVPVHRHAILRDMLDAGISRLSVALNTANRHEYDLLMEPCCRTTGIGGGAMTTGVEGDGGGGRSADVDDDRATLRPGTAHDLVCELIVESMRVGMDVEITGIDRPGIDKAETERLARLLLSARKGGDRRRSPVRWRRYFD